MWGGSRYLLFFAGAPSSASGNDSPTLGDCTIDMQAGSDTGSSSTDNRTFDTLPLFDIGLPSGYGDDRDAQADDVVVLEISDNAEFSDSIDDTLDAGEVASGAIALPPSDVLADGTYYARARITRGAEFGPWTSSLEFVIETVAPTLSSPLGSQLAQTTASIGVTTDEGNGTLYYVVTGSATPPSKAQVKAGENDGGTAAIFAGNQSISSTGAKTATATSVTAGTRYAYYMHEDAAGNQSDVSASSSWSQADITAPVLSSPTGTETGATTANIGATTDEGNGTLYVVASTSATPPTAAQIRAGQDHTGSAAAAAANASVSSTGAKTVGVTGLTAETGYYGHSTQRDAASNDSNVVSSTQFTTDAAGYTFVNAEAEAVVDEMVSEPDDTRKELIDDLVGALKTAGTWSKMDRLFVHLAHTEQAALLNWKNPSVLPLVNTNSMSFTADVGFSSNGTTSYLEGGASFSAIALSRDDAHLGGRVSGTLTDGQNCYPLGRATSNGRFSHSVGRAAGVTSVFPRLATTNALASATVTDATGYFVVTRRASNACEFYDDATSIANPTTASESVGSDNFQVGRSNGAFSAATIVHEFEHFGVALSDQEVTDTDAAFDAYIAGT